MMTHDERDNALKLLLESYSVDDQDFWSFRGKAVRDLTHGYFQYPAMMVPKMQNQLIGTVTQIDSSIRWIFDPFVGSGTVMTETMVQGMNFRGYDINPLAILYCRVKQGPFQTKVLTKAIQELVARVHKDQDRRVDIDFPGLDKWFQKPVAIELSRIRRSILAESELWIRRFFWAALAETVRLTSNSRTSTFKLHIRPTEELERQVLPIKTFIEIVYRNLESLSKKKAALEQKDLLKDDVYKGIIDIRLGDSSTQDTDHNTTVKCDLLITSPPYGDNVTTVPYGQYSYLPLQWISLFDIDPSIDPTCLETTHEIDRRSLGGVRAQALEETTELLDVSVHFKQTIESLQSEPPDRAIRVAAFCRDLNRCIEPILMKLNPNAYMFWIVGNRRVGGQQVPTDEILSELLSARGATPVAKIQRTIPSKRMALKNQTAETMGSETILVMRKAGCNDKH